MVSDRRFIEISLTDEGRQIIASFDELLRQRIETDLRTLSEKELAAVTESTTTILKFLNYLASAPLPPR